MESQWLGCWRGVILGALCCAEDKKRLKSAVAKFLKQVEIGSTKKELVEVWLISVFLPYIYFGPFSLFLIVIVPFFLH